MLIVTYDIVTPESAECGDVAESGVIAQDVDLRTALCELYGTRTSKVGGIEAIECIVTGRGLAVMLFNGQEFETGARETRILHVDGVTDSTANRIARMAMQ